MFLVLEYFQCNWNEVPNIHVGCCTGFRSQADFDINVKNKLGGKRCNVSTQLVYRHYFEGKTLNNRVNKTNFVIFFKEVQIFTLRLEEVSTKVPISQDVHKNLWENIAHIITHTLVQG